MKEKNKPLKDIIENLLKDLKKKPLVDEDDVIKRWDKTIGKRIKKHTRPVKTKNETLIVNVDSSSWLFELKTKHKNNILKKINKNLKNKKIEDIRFRIGEIQDDN